MSGPSKGLFLEPSTTARVILNHVQVASQTGKGTGVPVELLLKGAGEA